MKFIVDAQLPYKLALFIQEKGYDCVHTDDLPNKERTKDHEICALSVQESRIVISKDEDFLDHYMLKNIPQKLLWITTGNIKNKDLLALFTAHFDMICQAFPHFNLIELNNDHLYFHE